MFVNTFISRPILASVCSLIIILAGIVAIPTMPIAQFPPLAPPNISVTAVYTGANAQEVETAVTTPLEQAINGAEGMLYMSSSSSSSGVATITVTFDITRDQDLAQVDVQNRVATALGRLPTEVRQLGVTVAKQTTGFVMAGGVYAEKGEYDSLFLSNYIDVYVKDALKRVPGVSDVTIFGERKYSMRLWLDPQRLAARQITAADVTSALQQQNVQVAAGALGQQPAPAGQLYQLSVRVEGRLTEASQFDDMIVKAGADGSLVRLKDVGHAELGAETYASQLRFQGQDAVGFGVIQLPTANALDVASAVKAELLRLSKNFPPGLKVQIALDTTEVVHDSIQEVLKTLAEAIVLVIIVIFVFLQSWRSTIIPVITIPVSLVGAFGFIKLLDYSINTLTLFGLILATGIVVDDAIVVIENIERHIQEYKVPAKQAAVDAMGEVLGAVIATALVLIAVFVPIAFFPGTTGRIYAQFAMTIAFAVALSAFNAITLTPALSALLLDRAHHGKNRFFTYFERTISGGTNLYVRFITRGMKSRWALVVLFFVFLGLTYWTYGKVPQSFVPDEDQGYFITQVQAPAGASLQYTAAIAQQAEQLFLKDPDVMAVFSVMGFSFSGAAPNQGIVFVRLKSFGDRPGPSHSAQAVIGRLMPRLSAIPGAIIVGFSPPSIPGLSRFGGFEFQVLDQSGQDISTLARGAYGVMGAAAQSPLVRNVFTAFTANDPQLVVSVDRQRALASGLALNEITTALQTFLGSSYVNDFQFNNRAYRVYVQADAQFRSSPQGLKQIYVRSRSGQMVPLESVITVKEVTAPQVIGHFNLFRSATLNGAPGPGVSSGAALKEMERIAGETLPQGMTYAWSGISLEETKAGRQSVVIFGLALLLVYLTLAAQYESLVLPFIVLLGVPLAVLGALGAQWMRGLSNDVYCQIGLVMLIGLAAKNAILIVEFAEQLRHRGLSIVEAAIEAGRIRLRPILMTSLAFILGVLPLVFATGAGQEGRHSVGTAVAGGMILSTFLNIVFIPVLYVVIETLRERFTGTPVASPAKH
jgi:hydrophobic/amphiphilic exporter-1 (mainly G- bacteria), HAE1 family